MVSFFANFIEPCCKDKKKKKQAKLKKEEHSCCSKGRTCRAKKKPIVKLPLAKRCCSKNKSKEKKTAFKKRNCCSDKLNYSQSDVVPSLGELGIPFMTTTALLPPRGPEIVYASVACQDDNSMSISYSFLCFYPPPDIPLYIRHQSFLC